MNSTTDTAASPTPTAQDFPSDALSFRGQLVGLRMDSEPGLEEPSAQQKRRARWSKQGNTKDFCLNRLNELLSECKLPMFDVGGNHGSGSTVAKHGTGFRLRLVDMLGYAPPPLAPLPLVPLPLIPLPLAPLPVALPLLAHIRPLTPLPPPPRFLRQFSCDRGSC